MKDEHQWLKWVNELQAIAQNGLTYCKDPFCQLRYEALHKLAAEIITKHSNVQQTKIMDLFNAQYGYATPKLDLRGVVFQDDKILLVKEKADGLWALPGGWADVNESPLEGVIREILEETGYQTKFVKMLALHDQHKHEDPPQFPHVYKSFFLCEIIGGEPTENIEILEIGFFTEDKLPPLSPFRVSEEQIKRMFEHKRNPDWPMDID